MIPVVERTAVDGVQVLRADSVSGRHAAALVFRVGRFDETLPTAGITHLVEHLALQGKAKTAYTFNAAVSGRVTMFVMESAEPADIADYVAAVCNGLAADSSDVLSREIRVLRTEAASRGGAGAIGACLNERYGATGPGLLAYPEYGLRRLGWAEIEAWRRRWFVAENAVLWIAGEIPAGLRITLPLGAAPATAPLRPLAGRLPGYLLTGGGGGGVGLSLVGHQSVPAAVALAILAERLTQVLRHEHGLSYAVEATGEQLDGHLAHTWLAADALPEHQSMVAHTMLTTFESLAETGSQGAEVEDYATRLRTAYEAQGGPMTVLHQYAQNILTGRPVLQPDEVLRAVGETGPRSVSEAAQELLGQAIVATPQLVPAVQGRMPQLPQWSADTITGAQFMSRRSDAILTVGNQGVMLTAGAGQHVTVRSGAVAAVLRWTDGKRTLIGTDGFALQLDPGEWPDADAALTSLEASVEQRLRVDLDSAGPVRPGADQDAASPQAPAPASGSDPASAQSAPATVATAAPTPARSAAARWSARIIRAVWFAVLLFGALAIVGGTWDGAIFAAIGLVGLTASEVQLRRRARRRA